MKNGIASLSFFFKLTVIMAASLITDRRRCRYFSNQLLHASTGNLTTQISVIEYFIWFTRSYDGFVHGFTNSRDWLGHKQETKSQPASRQVLL